MAAVTIFYQTWCPYCRHAKKAVEALRAESAAYAAVEIEWVEENRERARAAQYDYWFVPSVYQGDHKLYEADPSQRYDEIKERLRAALEAALEAEA